MPILMQWLRWDMASTGATFAGTGSSRQSTPLSEQDGGLSRTPPRPPQPHDSAATAEQARARCGLRSAVCGVLWCLSRLDTAHPALHRPSSVECFLQAVGVKDASVLAAVGSTWEVFILGM